RSRTRSAAPRRVSPASTHGRARSWSKARRTAVYAPDVVEPIVGWRLWRIAERGGSARLRSLFVHDVWPYLEPLQARCAVPRLSRRRRPPHDPPVTDCDCGIYATSWRDVSAHLHASW